MIFKMRKEKMPNLWNKMRILWSFLDSKSFDLGSIAENWKCEK